MRWILPLRSGLEGALEATDRMRFGSDDERIETPIGAGVIEHNLLISGATSAK